LTLTIAIVLLVGFAGGILAGLFGVGGGIIFVPTLAFGLGLSQLHAEATSLLAILPTAAVGSWRQLRYGRVRPRVAAIVGIGSVIGVQFGVVVAKQLPEHALQRLFGLFLLVTAVHIVWRTSRT
jgi:uncharacterized membrane protein YfcA